MPKVPSSLPVSGLFAVTKPSGPTSMSVVNDIKKLVVSSLLFVEPSKLQHKSSKQKDREQKRGRFAKDAVKIGQGGTLDPLADGVLGTVMSQHASFEAWKCVWLTTCSFSVSIYV